MTEVVGMAAVKAVVEVLGKSQKRADKADKART